MKRRARILEALGKRLTLEFEYPFELLGLSDVDVEIAEHKDKRSLDSNAYFHVLCDKLRQVLGISLAECKNNLICSYGQIEYVDDMPAVIHSNIPPDKMVKQDMIHAHCESVNGDGTYMYIVYRGSHTYNTAEMSKLIGGTVEECKAQGIETATPQELRRMFGEEHGQQSERKKSKEQRREGRT